MANNRISVIIDVAVDKANKSLQGFRQSLKEAEGASGKFKVGAGAALDSIKANAGNLAMAGGAALITFGAKAVSAFQDLALEAGKMSDALGIPVEDMSRLIEVAGDLGIETSSLESTIGRMNRAAASTPEAFEAINAQIVKNKDGTTNVNETFLATVDALNRIPDATERAEAAQKIFGRSWQNIAELVGRGADDIRESLEGVSDQQIIDEDEVRQAREYREAMDNLQDALGRVTLAVGGALTPALTTIANAMDVIITGLDEIDSRTGGGLFDGLLSSEFWKFGPAWDNGPGRILKEITGFEGEEPAAEIGEVEESFDGVSAAVEETGEDYKWWAQDMRSESQKIADANEAATRRIEAAWDSLDKELSDRSGYLDIEDALDDVEAAYMTAMDTAGKSITEQEADARNLERAIIDLKGKINDYAEEIAGLPPEYATEISALIDEGKFAEVERRLATLEKIRIARITPETYMPGGGVQVKSGSKIHTGGVVGVGNFASNEVPAVLEKGEMVLNEAQQAAVSSQLGGTSRGGINVTINTGADPNAVVDVIRKYQRYNGTNWGT